MAKPLTLLTHQKAKFEWTPIPHTAFLMLKESVAQAPILCYLDPTERYIVYTDASIAFLLHTFMDIQKKWSTTQQEAFGMYYAVTKWNYCLHGTEGTVHNDHKLLARFINGKNTNNKVNRWGLEFTTYNITFKWIWGARNKAAGSLSRLVELPHETSHSSDALCHQPW